jgi:(p)ppGpp synthase/HD superfamily hydrolase
MSDNETFLKALCMAEKAHQGQTRWEGDPYIVHPRRVAEAVDGWDAKIVAVLHDVVEDSSYNLDDVRMQFGDIIMAGVDSVTHRDGESYCAFVLRSRANELGRVVKIADIVDNLRDIDKFDNQQERKDKYILAKHILELPPL